VHLIATVTGLQDQISPNSGITTWMGPTQRECDKQTVLLTALCGLDQQPASWTEAEGSGRQVVTLAVKFKMP